jgi:hypothetical protein
MDLIHHWDGNAPGGGKNINTGRYEKEGSAQLTLRCQETLTEFFYGCF